ncbi:MAG: hypothetical protein ACR2P5_06805 [Gammaproteobacteria bacterium]
MCRHLESKGYIWHRGLLKKTGLTSSTLDGAAIERKHAKVMKLPAEYIVRGHLFEPLPGHDGYLIIRDPRNMVVSLRRYDERKTLFRSFQSAMRDYHCGETVVDYCRGFRNWDNVLRFEDLCRLGYAKTRTSTGKLSDFRQAWAPEDHACFSRIGGPELLRDWGYAPS